MNRYLQEQAKDAISRAQHTTRTENVNLEPGTWVIVSASAGHESDVQVDESSPTPGSIQISPRELTRNQGELALSSLENAIR